MKQELNALQEEKQIDSERKKHLEVIIQKLRSENDELER
jgi:hypothetical protein